MKILVTGGGTAGHINPALAIVSYIKEKHSNAEILYIGKKGGMEEKLVPKAGYNFKSINISGFQRKPTPKNLVKNTQTIVRMVTSSIKARKLIKEFAPDVCFGTGGFVCGPVLREAIKLGIPSYIHESNAFPGVTVKMLAKKLNAVMIPVENEKKYFSNDTRTVVTGNPIRQELLKTNREEARKRLGVDDRPLIVSFGGSLGARAINNAIAPFLERSFKDKKYQHIHGYGLAPANKKFKENLAHCNDNVSILEYISNMNDCMAAADLIISRAGAITVTEISALSKASILIPSPNVAENHQYHNAMSLVDLGGARILEEKELTPEKLMEMADAILSDKENLNLMEKNSHKLYLEDCSERIYNVIMETL